MSSQTRGKPKRTVLSCDSLEAREVPAQFNLATSGSSAVIDGAIFQQSDAARLFPGRVGAFSSFLRIDGNGDEQGYNTDARSVQFDTVSNRSVTHALRLSDVPLVTIDGKQYREFVLDINQRRGLPMLSLDQIKVFSDNDSRLRGYNERTGRLDGRTAVYDMDAGSNDWIRLDARTGQSANQGGDMRMYVPANLFSGRYVYVFSQFGDHFGANGGAETWGTVTIRPPVVPPSPPTVPPSPPTVPPSPPTVPPSPPAVPPSPPAVPPSPPPAPTSGTFTGRVWIDRNGNGAYDDGEGMAGVTVFADKLATDLSGSDTLEDGESSDDTASDGTFTITNVPLSYEAINSGDIGESVMMTDYKVRMNNMPPSFYEDLDGSGSLTDGDITHSLIIPDNGNLFCQVSTNDQGTWINLNFMYNSQVFVGDGGGNG